MRKYLSDIDISEIKSAIKNEIVYKAGDVESIRWQGAGFITTGGQSLRFTLPLNKPVSAKTATLSGNLTLRQEQNYIYGDASENTLINNLKQQFQGFSACGATFNIHNENKYTNAVNNHAVGVLFDGTITFS